MLSHLAPRLKHAIQESEGSAFSPQHSSGRRLAVGRGEVDGGPGELDPSGLVGYVVLGDFDLQSRVAGLQEGDEAAFALQGVQQGIGLPYGVQAEWACDGLA